jgi:hypothetical protein
MGEWLINLTGSGHFKKWVSQMTCDVLALWVETFGSVELTESCVYTGIPEISEDFCSESQRGKSAGSRLIYVKTVNTERIERPIRGTGWPGERG